MATKALSSSPASDLYQYACATCHKRKVKCDRKDPCSNCVKHGTECEFRAPPPPRKRKHPEDAVEVVTMPGLQPFKGALRKIGAKSGTVSERTSEITSTDDVFAKNSSVPPATDRVQGQDKTRVTRQSTGRLISREGNSIYLDQLVRLRVWI